jgi:hypothetical protein
MNKDGHVGHITVFVNGKYCSFSLLDYLLFKAGFDVIKKFKGEKKAIEKMATKFPQIL